MMGVLEQFADETIEVADSISACADFVCCTENVTEQMKTLREIQAHANNLNLSCERILNLLKE